VPFLALRLAAVCECDDCATALLYVCFLSISFERMSEPACLPAQTSERASEAYWFLFLFLFLAYPMAQHRHQHHTSTPSTTKNTTLNETTKQHQITNTTQWRQVASEDGSQGCFLLGFFWDSFALVYPTTGKESPTSNLATASGTRGLSC
jgi:hypothetical protein